MTQLLKTFLHRPPRPPRERHCVKHFTDECYRKCRPNSQHTIRRPVLGSINITEFYWELFYATMWWYSEDLSTGLLGVCHVFNIKSFLCPTKCTGHILGRCPGTFHPYLTGPIAQLAKWQWSNPESYGFIDPKNSPVSHNEHTPMWMRILEKYPDICSKYKSLTLLQQWGA